jgi:hypothetical protein
VESTEWTGVKEVMTLMGQSRRVTGFYYYYIGYAAFIMGQVVKSTGTGACRVGECDFIGLIPNTIRRRTAVHDNDQYHEIATALGPDKAPVLDTLVLLIRTDNTDIHFALTHFGANEFGLPGMILAARL